MKCKFFVSLLEYENWKFFVFENCMLILYIEGYDVIRIGIFVILIELLKILKEIFLYGMIDGGEILCGLW